MRRRRIGQKHWWTELSCALCAHRIARSIGLWARSCGRAVVSWKLGKPCPRSATWVINVSWMARNKCQHASRPRRLAVLTLRPVLWSVPYIALCSGVHRKIPTPPIASTPILQTLLSQQPSDRTLSRLPSQIPNRILVSGCTCPVLCPAIFSSYIILVPSYAGYHRDLAKSRLKQHEIVVIPGNTQRKRRDRGAPERKDAGRWSPRANSGLTATTGEERARPGHGEHLGACELVLPG